VADCSKVSIDPISSKSAMAMVLTNHYSRRKVGARYCFGVKYSGLLIGCVVYSQPASYTLCNGVCGPEYRANVLELSRLVLTEQLPNLASQAISQTLKKLGNAVVVSYADCNDHVGHVGYVYQATNWIYTGQGTAEPKWLHPTTGEVVSHTRRHVDIKAQRIGLNWRDLVKGKQVGKHRYVIFCGSRAFKKRAKTALRYPICDYPKGPTTRHAAIEADSLFN
jgi:hypothetical protein